MKQKQLKRHRIPIGGVGGLKMKTDEESDILKQELRRKEKRISHLIEILLQNKICPDCGYKPIKAMCPACGFLRI